MNRSHYNRLIIKRANRIKLAGMSEFKKNLLKSIYNYITKKFGGPEGFAKKFQEMKEALKEDMKNPKKAKKANLILQKKAGIKDDIMANIYKLSLSLPKIMKYKMIFMVVAMIAAYLGTPVDNLLASEPAEMMQIADGISTAVESGDMSGMADAVSDAGIDISADEGEVEGAGNYDPDKAEIGMSANKVSNMSYKMQDAYERVFGDQRSGGNVAIENQRYQSTLRSFSDAIKEFNVGLEKSELGDKYDFKANEFFDAVMNDLKSGNKPSSIENFIVSDGKSGSEVFERLMKEVGPLEKEPEDFGGEGQSVEEESTGGKNQDYASADTVNEYLSKYRQIFLKSLKDTINSWGEGESYATMDQLKELVTQEAPQDMLKELDKTLKADGVKLTPHQQEFLKDYFPKLGNKYWSHISK